MMFYLVKDASNWMSNLVFKSIDQAIISQSWRVDDLFNVVKEDFPLSILQIDTESGLMMEIKKVKEADLIVKVNAYGGIRKGGSK